MRAGFIAWTLFACLPQQATGQGMPFHTPSALTMSFEERGMRVFSAVQSRGDVTSVVAPLVLLPFAPHERLTTAVNVPLMYKRTRDLGGTRSEGGLGDVEVSAKFAFFVRSRFAGTTRAALILGASLPTGATGASVEDGPAARPPLPLGSGAASASATVAATIVRGRWGLGASIGHTRHGAEEGFRLGPATRYDLAASVRIPKDVATIRTRTLQIYLEWNGSVAQRSTRNRARVVDTGGHVAYLSPGLQWVLLPRLLIEGSLQVPVVQDHNGAQLDYGMRPAFGARFLFF